MTIIFSTALPRRQPTPTDRDKAQLVLHRITKLGQLHCKWHRDKPHLDNDGAEEIVASYTEKLYSLCMYHMYNFQ